MKNQRIKQIVFFALLPIYTIIGFFLYTTYQWWADLYEKGGGWTVVLFACFIPIYAPLALFMYLTYEPWFVHLLD